MKTQKDKLKLKRHSIVELSDKQISKIQGGSWNIIVETLIRTATGGTWIDHGPL